MGNILLCKCESCLVIKEQELNDNNSQKIIPISKKLIEKNEMFFSNTNINPKNDLSTSFDDSLKKNDNNNNIILPLVNILLSSQFYEKLIKGERFHNLLQFLYKYNNNILFSLLLFIFEKIKYILTEPLNIEKEIKILHHNFKIKYLNLVDKNIIEEIKENMEEQPIIKYNLIYIIESSLEVFHFFCFFIFNNKKPYNKFYWDKYNNFNQYISQKINEVKNGIININLSLGDNKLKIIE